jgi:hypothetical protein
LRRLRVGMRPMIDIHVDVGANRARRIIEELAVWDTPLVEAISRTESRPARKSCSMRSQSGCLVVMALL